MEVTVWPWAKQEWGRIDVTDAQKVSSDCVWLFVTSWTIALQVPLSMGFSRQEYWSGLPFPPPGDLPDSGIRTESPESPASQGGSLLLSCPKCDSRSSKSELKVKFWEVRLFSRYHYFVSKSCWSCFKPRIDTCVHFKNSTGPADKTFWQLLPQVDLDSSVYLHKKWNRPVSTGIQHFVLMLICYLTFCFIN